MNSAIPGHTATIDEPVRHPPEVTEAAIYMSQPTKDLVDYEKYARVLLCREPLRTAEDVVRVASISAKVLRDALACAEAEREQYRASGIRQWEEFRLSEQRLRDELTIERQRREKAERELAEAWEDTELLDALLNPAWHPIPGGWPYPDTRGRYDPPFIVQWKNNSDDGSPMCVTEREPINTRERLRQAINKAATKGGAK